MPTPPECYQFYTSNVRQKPKGTVCFLYNASTVGKSVRMAAPYRLIDPAINTRNLFPDPRTLGKTLLNPLFATALLI